MVGRETRTQRKYFFSCQVFQQAIFEPFGEGLKPTGKQPTVACCATVEDWAIVGADQN